MKFIKMVNVIFLMSYNHQAFQDPQSIKELKLLRTNKWSDLFNQMMIEERFF